MSFPVSQAFFFFFKHRSPTSLQISNLCPISQVRDGSLENTTFYVMCSRCGRPMDEHGGREASRGGGSKTGAWFCTNCSNIATK